MKERWPRGLNLPVTRANHGIDNDRKETHATLTGMGDFNCEAEIDLSPRGDLSCAQIIFYLLFFYLTFCSSSSYSKRECVFYGATETLIVIMPHRSQSYRNRIWNPAREGNFSIYFCTSLKFKNWILNFYFYSVERRHRFLFGGSWTCKLNKLSSRYLQLVKLIKIVRLIYS